MAKNNVETFISKVLGFQHKSHGASWLGVSHTAVGKWVSGDADFPYATARKYGVNYEWIMGHADEMWSEEFRSLRLSLKAYLAKNGVNGADASQRFRQVVTWLMQTAPNLASERYVARICRADEELRPYMDGVKVGPDALRRLAAWVGIAETWFATGDVGYLATYEDSVVRAREAGITAKELRDLVEFEARRRGTM